MWKCEVCRVRYKAQQWKTPGPTGMGELNTMEDRGEREWGVSSTDEDVPMIQNLREGEGVGGLFYASYQPYVPTPSPAVQIADNICSPETSSRLITWFMRDVDTMISSNTGTLPPGQCTE